jgi:hypothetical protein
MKEEIERFNIKVALCEERNGKLIKNLLYNRRRCEWSDQKMS